MALSLSASKSPQSLGRQNSRKIHEAVCAVHKRDCQTIIRSQRQRLDPPGRGGDYSSGLIRFGCCLDWHGFQSSINSSRCSTAYSMVRASARRGRLPPMSSSVRMSIRASCSAYIAWKEVRRRVFAPEHLNDNTEELADCRHRVPRHHMVLPDVYSRYHSTHFPIPYSSVVAGLNPVSRMRSSTSA